MFRRNIVITVGLAFILLAGYVFFAGDGERFALEATETNTGLPHSFGSEFIVPLPEAPSYPKEKVALGKRLFHEPRLSGNDTISCASCHNLGMAGVDRMPVSVGINGALGVINAPTVFNSGFNFVQFWDGRAATLEEQAAGPVHNPLEMGSNWQEAIPKLSADQDYRQTFQSIYADGVTANNVADALATFQRTLVTPNSRFDRFLRGDKNALNQLERRGQRLFFDYGCVSCHQGVNIGGNLFQQFGVIAGYFLGREISEADLGRFNVTGEERDRHVFKVPGLRNIALTSPYFHDGSAATLEKAVAVMGRHQLGRELSEDDVAAIVAFLGTLTGEWNGKLLE